MSDYISRETAIALLKKWADGYSHIETPTEDAINEFNAIPAANVRPVEEGEWVKNKDRVGWHCSVCKVDNNFAYNWNSETGKVEFQDNYCPCCGAKMGGADG